MKILFIAPLPPPVNGQSVVSKVLYDHLHKLHDVAVVDYNKDSYVEGISSFKRIFEVLGILMQIGRKKRNADVIYMNISESFAGNIKDVCTYLICYSKLSKTYIHLHGGSIKRLLWNKKPWLYKLNRFFIKKLAGVIISGESHMEVFSGMIEKKRIHSIPNFAPDDLFVDEEDVRSKFRDTEPLRLLYMSNMTEKKGYEELAKAFIGLPLELQQKMRIDFAGRFELESQKKGFTDLIANQPQLIYHGAVSNEQKQVLFAQAHVFCLPTSFFEGQPVSILEAYAAGCVVVTTGQSGILDIFDPLMNGFKLRDGEQAGIRDTLEDVIFQKNNLPAIALLNLKQAREKYKTSTYQNSLNSLLESTIHS